MTPTIIELGTFAGGSFGLPGDPSNVYNYYAIDCREFREAKATGVVGAIAPYVYRERATAERNLKGEAVLVKWVGGRWEIVFGPEKTYLVEAHLRQNPGQHWKLFTRMDAERIGLLPTMTLPRRFHSPEPPG